MLPPKSGAQGPRGRGGSVPQMGGARAALRGGGGSVPPLYGLVRGVGGHLATRKLKPETETQNPKLKPKTQNPSSEPLTPNLPPLNPDT